MAYNAVPTVNTGDLWTAANHNTYIKDNFAAGVPDIFTTKGDLAVASGADAAARLAVGSNGQFVRANSAATNGVDWRSHVAERQGGSASDWGAQGNNNYTPTAAKIEVGCIRWTGGAASSGNVAITFPEAFSGTPVILATCLSSNGNVMVTIVHTAGTGFTLYWANASGTSTTKDFQWLAIGPL